MCELFYIHKTQGDVIGRDDVKLLRQLMLASVCPNKDGWGILTSDGEVVKSQHIKSLAGVNLQTCLGKKWLVGHTRLATHGGINQQNTQPIESKRFVVAHNGVFSSSFGMFNGVTYDNDDYDGYAWLRNSKHKNTGISDTVEWTNTLERNVEEGTPVIDAIANNLHNSYSIFVFDRLKKVLYYAKSAGTSFYLSLFQNTIYGFTKRRYRPFSGKRLGVFYSRRHVYRGYIDNYSLYQLDNVRGWMKVGKSKSNNIWYNHQLKGGVYDAVIQPKI